MTNNKNVDQKAKLKSKKSWFQKTIYILLILVLIATIGLGAVFASILMDAPEINPSEINASLDQTSFIYDSEGNLIEKIEAAEFRTFVGISEIPQHLKDSFIAIEDERFYDHSGVDPKGIMSAAAENIKAGGIVRGASTITQQLVKNVYLTNEQKFTRKIQEAYLSLQLERELSKDQILEAYLNRNFFGNNAYGVQEAAQTYFAKDVGDLTIAESALLAGVVKGSTQYQPYMRYSPDDFNPDIHFQVGEADVLGEKYILVFNEEAVKRQKLVLSKMRELDLITSDQYNQAINEDMKVALQPGSKRVSGITSYFADFVKSEAIELLQAELDLDKDQAEEKLFTGGLEIYTTIDVELQKELEDVYNNFAQVILGNTDYHSAPLLISWRLDGYGNIKDREDNLIYYKEYNLFDGDHNLFIENGTYSFSDEGNLIINNNKLNPYPKHIDIADYYRIDDRKNLVTHTVGSLTMSEEDFSIAEDGSVIINKSFLDRTADFHSVNENGHLIINDNYFYKSSEGAIQPQSASVIMDYRKGHIKALVGGRELDGSRILNRATDSVRQPGSAIKPLSVYLPALDNGYTAGSAIDDIPHMHGGRLWPENVYKSYWGLQSLRRSVEQSINVNSVKTLNSIGIDTSMEYLARMGIINKSDPSADNFVTAEEAANKAVNDGDDQNPSALALGGMTDGLSPLEVTAAYGAIANEGVYIEPTPILKILDQDGDLLIDHTPLETVVVSPQVAYIMKDILKTTAERGFTSNARLNNMAAGGKTGTTEYRADVWYAGFTPYYVSAVWIGSDSPAITMGSSRTSADAAALWNNIMTRAHEGLEPVTSFKRPDGIVTAQVCTQSGKAPTQLCYSDPRGTVVSEIFVAGTEPSQSCDVHVSVDIDGTTGLVANDYCPAGSVVNKILIRTNPIFNPANYMGITPSDYSYRVPGPCYVHSAKSPGFDEEDIEDEDIEDEEDNTTDSENDNIEDPATTDPNQSLDRPKPNVPSDDDSEEDIDSGS